MGRTTKHQDHPPLDAGTAVCPEHPTRVLRFRRYWEKPSKSHPEGRYTSAAKAHCPECRGSVRLNTDGTTVSNGAQRVLRGTCPDCGKPRAHGAERCRACANRHQREQETTWEKVRHCRFRGCGQPLQTYGRIDPNGRTRGRVYCSDLCARSEAKAKRAERLKAVGALTDSPKRRPKARDRRLALAFRDGYTCHLCGDLVDLSLPAGHPGAFTLDHVLPLAQGGDDTDENLRTAHHGCNAAKGARVSA